MLSSLLLKGKMTKIKNSLDKFRMEKSISPVSALTDTPSASGAVPLLGPFGGVLFLLPITSDTAGFLSSEFLLSFSERLRWSCNMKTDFYQSTLKKTTDEGLLSSAALENHVSLLTYVLIALDGACDLILHCLFRVVNEGEI